MWLLTEPIFGIGVYDVAEMLDPTLVDNPDGLKEADPGKLHEICQRLQQAIYTDPAGETVIFRLAQPWAPFLATLTNGWVASAHEPGRLLMVAGMVIALPGRIIMGAVWMS